MGIAQSRESTGRSAHRDAFGAEMPPQAVPGTAHDLRTFIHRLTDAGRLIRVEETVDWRFEIGERTRADRRPLLFERINDYPGQSVFANGLCDLSSIGLALGLEPGIPSGACLLNRGRDSASPFRRKSSPRQPFSTTNCQEAVLISPGSPFRNGANSTPDATSAPGTSTSAAIPRRRRATSASIVCRS